MPRVLYRKTNPNRRNARCPVTGSDAKVDGVEFTSELFDTQEFHYISRPAVMMAVATLYGIKPNDVEDALNEHVELKERLAVLQSEVDRNTAIRKEKVKDMRSLLTELNNV